MAIAEELQVVIDAKVKDAVRNLKGFEGQMKKTEKSTGDVAKAMLKKAAAAGAAAVSVRALVSLAKESVQLYGRQIQAENRLAAAIRTTGGEVADLLPKYKDFASEIQNITTVGDEATLELIGLGKQMGVTEDRIEEATRGAIGLSKAFGIDAQTAMRGVALAFEGNFTQLSRYIPALRTTNDEGEKLAILQRAMANGFEVAKAETESGFGALLQYQNAVGDLKEELGRAIVEGAEPFIRVLTGFATRTLEAINKTREFRDVLKTLETDGVESLTDLEAAEKSLNIVRTQARTITGFQVSEYLKLTETAKELETQIGRLERSSADLLSEQQQFEDMRMTAELEEQAKALRANAEALEALSARERERLTDQQKQLIALDQEIEKYGALRNELRATGRDYGGIQALINDLVRERRSLIEVTEEETEVLTRVWDEQFQAALKRLDAEQLAYDIRMDNIEAEKKKIQELETEYGILANRFSSVSRVMIDTLKETGDIGEAVWQGLQQAAKETFAMILEGLAKEAIARAALAAASFRFAQAGAYTAAAAGALGAAQAVRSFRTGGVVNEPVVGVGQNTGKSYTFAENGPERIEPSAGGGDMMQVIVNLDGKPILDTIQRASNNGRLLINARAVV